MDNTAPKIYGCTLLRALPGHISVSGQVVRNYGRKWLKTPSFEVKPDPCDYTQLGQFVDYKGKTYYVSMNHRVYETNIVSGDLVRFMGREVAYKYVDNRRFEPVTMRKLYKLEWLFL